MCFDREIVRRSWQSPHLYRRLLRSGGTRAFRHDLDQTQQATSAFRQTRYFLYAASISLAGVAHLSHLVREAPSLEAMQDLADWPAAGSVDTALS